MQANYAFKKWQMLSTITKIVNNVEEGKRTKIDKKLVDRIENLIEQEQLILRYSTEHKIPPQMAKDQMHVDKILKWKLKYEES